MCSERTEELSCSARGKLSAELGTIYRGARRRRLLPVISEGETDPVKRVLSFRSTKEWRNTGTDTAQAAREREREY